MLDMLLILCALIWIAILLHQIAHRSFAVMAVWLFIAPVASNVVNSPNHNPIFNSPDPIFAPEGETRRANSQGLSPKDTLAIMTRSDCTSCLSQRVPYLGLFWSFFCLMPL